MPFFVIYVMSNKKTSIDELAYELYRKDSEMGDYYTVPNSFFVGHRRVSVFRKYYEKANVYMRGRKLQKMLENDRQGNIQA